jgi:hypothetical protein
MPMQLDPALAMAYPRAVAREILIGAAEPINQHLVGELRVGSNHYFWSPPSGGRP